MQEIRDNLRIAVEQGRTDIIRGVLEACETQLVPDEPGAVTKEKILNSPCLEEGTFLHLATKLNHGDVVRTLLAFGSDPRIQNKLGLNAVDAANSHHLREIYVEELLRATASSDCERVCQLLAAGISVNSWDSEESGNTPLHWAACYGNQEIVSCLIDRGADVNCVNSLGVAPLHDAVARGDIDVIEELLRGGANPCIRAIKGKFAGKSAFELASQKPSLELILTKLAAYEPSTTVAITGDLNNCSLNSEQAPHLKRNIPTCHNNRKSSTSSMTSPKKDRLRSVSLESYDVLNRGNNGYVSNGDGSVQNNHPPLNHSQSVNYGHEPMSPKNSRRSLYSSQASLDLAPRIDQMVESLVRTHINTPVAPLVTQGPLHLLWPQPQHIVELGGDTLESEPEEPFLPHKELHISVVQGNVSVHRILDVWDLSRTALLALGYNVKIGDIQPVAGMETESQVECTVNEDLFSHRDAYQIHISSIKVKIAAASLAGLHYALCTFTQLLRLSVAAAEQEGRKPNLPPVLIQDYPTQRHRAVLLDISPNGRVPILDYLFHLIDVWSSLKISHLHLYTRLLPSHEWQLCYSKSEMVTIDRYCQDRFISLVPVLDVEPHVNYKHLAKMWPAFQEIIASFPNISYVHVGPRLSSLLLARDNDPSSHRCPNDSTEAAHQSSSISVDNEDLDRSRGESDRLSLALETDAGHYGVPSFMRELWHRLDLPPNITLMLCANGLHSRFYNIPANVVLVEYGFQADYDFVQWTQDFRQQGNMTCLCPGTASWNSLAGCPEASICNIYRAVQAAQKQGSLGVVIAHWSGSFHLTPHPFSLPGFVVGAGLAWNASTHWDYLHTSLPALLDTHVFLDSAGVVGGVVLELGYAETLVLRVSRGQDRGDPRDLPPQDGSALYKLLTDPDGVNLERTPADLFARVSKHIKRCQTSLYAAKPQCRFAEMVVQELQLAADLLLTSCRIGRSLVSVGTNPNSNMGLSVINLGISNLPPTFRTDIANKLLAHIEQYKGTWLQRHLPAGLQSSLLILTSVLRRFVPDESCSSVCSDTAPEQRF